MTYNAGGQVEERTVEGMDATPRKDQASTICDRFEWDPLDDVEAVFEDGPDRRARRSVRQHARLLRALRRRAARR